MNVFEVFGDVNQARDNYCQQLLDLKVTTNSSGDISSRTNKVILYDENYLRINGTSNVVRGRIKVGTDPVDKGGDPRDQKLEFVTGQCQTWGVYLVARDLDGNEIDRVLLYIFNTGDCNLILDAEFVTPDYGGGANLPSERDAEIQREYARNIKASITPHSEESYGTADLVQGTFAWNVVTGALGWKEEAITKFSYQRTNYYDVNTLQSRPAFDFIDYRTLSSKYIGSNVVVSTTWDPIEPVDVVHNDNSEIAQGESWVYGIITHKWIGGTPDFIPVPFTSKSVQNSARFFPR